MFLTWSSLSRISQKKEGLSPFLLTLVEHFLHEFLGPLNGPTVPSITARYQDEHGREISNLPSHELAGNRQHGNRKGGDEGQLEALDEHFRVEHDVYLHTRMKYPEAILPSYFTNIIYALFTRKYDSSCIIQSTS